MISFGKDHYSDAYAALQRELNQDTTHVAQAATQTATTVARVASNTAANVADKVAAPVIQAVVSTPAPTPSPVPTITPAISTLPAPDAAATLGGGHLDYARDIEPIFQANCVKCHNDQKKKGGYRLDAKDRIFAAGESGNVPILPGKADESRLVKMLEGKGEFADSLMPPKGAPLTYQQVQLIRQWIDEGAKTSNP
jgi:hypothetical protein